MDEVPNIYTNQTMLQVTSWDVVIRLGMLPVPPIPEESIEVLVEEMARIRMTHSHAKLVTILLRRLIKTYEASEGEINLPNSVKERHQITDEDW